MGESNRDEWRIEPLDRATHDRSHFDCGNASLDDWLRKRAGQYDRRGLSRTYVLLRAGEVHVRGYYAVSNHSITFDALPPGEAKGLPQIDVPVMLLGRLAVDRSVQGQGLGAYLLVDALRRAEYLSKHVGVRAVEVHAIDNGARAFYLKYGFMELRDDPHHLFLPVAVIRALKLPPLNP